MLAPKPCLSKLGPASGSLHQPPHRETQRAEGPLYPQRDVHRENKKPDWGYIIPICLCSKENCRCIRNKLVSDRKVEKDLKVLHKVNGNAGNNTQLFHKSQRTFDPHRTWSDDNVEPQGEPGQGQEEDVLGSEQASQPKPPSAGPPKPVPVPRKPRTAALAHQEKVEEEREEITGRDGAEMNVKEVKVLLEGKGISSPSAGAPVEKQPALLSAGKACVIPDPPRKKPLLSVPEKTSTSAPQTLPKDAKGEDLGWDSTGHYMQMYLDKGGEVAEEEERDGKRDREMVCSDSARNLPGSCKPPAVAAAAGEGAVKVGPQKPQRSSSPMAWMSANDSSAENREKLRDQERRQNPADGALKADVSRTFLTPAPVKPSRSSLSKHKSKSFSAPDLIRSEGQRRNSFQKLLNLKLKMLPKLKTKADQIPAGAAPYTEQSVDGEFFIYEQKLPGPVIEVEHCVDGDDLYYENISHYEEIADYINVEVGSATRAPLVPLAPLTPGNCLFLQPAAWQSPAYNDEGIYEEPDLYIPFEKNGDQHCPTSSDCER